LNCDGITDKGVSALGNQLRTCKKLTGLNLVLSQLNNLNEEGILNLCLGMGGLGMLESLSISVSRLGIMTAGYLEGLEESLKSLKELKKLTLVMKNVEVSEEEVIKSFGVTLESMKKLEFVKISFGDSLSDEIVEGLLNNLKKIKNFQLC
jgi:hypothetical protein